MTTCSCDAYSKWSRTTVRTRSWRPYLLILIFRVPRRGGSRVDIMLPARLLECDSIANVPARTADHVIENVVGGFNLIRTLRSRRWDCSRERAVRSLNVSLVPCTQSKKDWSVVNYWKLILYQCHSYFTMFKQIFIKKITASNCRKSFLEFIFQNEQDVDNLHDIKWKLEIEIWS